MEIQYLILNKKNILQQQWMFSRDTYNIKIIALESTGLKNELYFDFIKAHNFLKFLMIHLCPKPVLQSHFRY